jgi:dipeptidyl-peptidase-4
MKPKILMLQKISGIMYQYQDQGPASSQSMEFSKWLLVYDATQQGYIVACVDGRGTGFKGADQESDSIRIRKYEVEDQIDAAKVIGNYVCR